MLPEKSEDLISSISQKQFDFTAEGWGTFYNRMDDISHFVTYGTLLLPFSCPAPFYDPPL